MKEKGIENAVNAVENINRNYNRMVYKLDIYSPIDPNEEDWFEKIRDKFPNYIRYCGVVEPQNSVSTVRNYFAMLFPTHFYTEGIPGTIIDAYASGVPVIASKWISFYDGVDENVTGIGYPVDGLVKLEDVLESVIHCPKKIIDMKMNCLKKAQSYIPKNSISVLLDNLYIE